MKAMLFYEYGNPNVLQLREVERPSLQANHVLIKVHSASINTLDWNQMTGPIMIRMLNGALHKPKINSLGLDLAGWVEAVGPQVTKFKPGDAVFGTAQGSLAEYVCATEDQLVLKPANVAFEAAAATPVAAFTAIYALSDLGKIQAGQRVLINGASGAVGSFAIQIAKAYGAEVTAVCSSRNADIAQASGASHWIDYSREDLRQHRQRYDLILGVNGYQSIFTYRKALTPTGRYIAIGGALPQILQAVALGRILSLGTSKTLQFLGVAPIRHTTLLKLQQLLESGQLKPVIDRCYRLPEAAEALRYLGAGHAQGKIVINVL
ncbi:MAG TPA: NAD(P)-dependent alcohol dehydrogenase [Herpetosiphon sp.]|uniref:Alcohol dehydrogenase zinc-binding domain protein n=1 Tax=Herpetosiphon aurantiacus (strain ATCC 23779 / DSM 785 / 114-95) TaxID=316274 RepID=A9B6R0_HERA2|nr:NAD(P)-dependent alcohol dehydrogenase [Herpetosiphon sp.]ABX04369.1 Alcohol dehydrogenase zinc-binding domain protein [Herpetosiphon aurantiacus DSM 785]HBW52376.1 NAD(P)-dependent alcohol dehydrogenase [Herpetosiphon sp.]